MKSCEHIYTSANEYIRTIPVEKNAVMVILFNGCPVCGAPTNVKNMKCSLYIDGVFVEKYAN